MGETELGKKRKSGSRDNKPNTTNILQLKTRKLNPVNTTSFLQILGTGMDTQDTSPSVLLFFDKQRFIFNAGEGLQRYCTEHKIKLSKIDHIFLSRVCSETAGGLPGLLLTMAGIGDKGMCVKIWGPPGLDYLVDAMDTFITSAAMVHTKSFGPTLQSDGITITDPKKFSGPFDLVDDEVVKISAILLHPNENNGSASSIKPCDISVIYVCELPKIQGKFHPEKAKALGLKPGPKYRDLQNDMSVKSDNLDIMVHPSDVMDPPVPGPVVILVDCPTTSHLQSLLSVDSLKVYYKDYSDNNSAETSKEVNCVIHLSPSSVSNNCAYQEWMTRFGNAQHIMAGHAEKNAEIPVLRASARISARLNYLCPWLFPASGFCSPHINNSSTEGAQPVISAENLLKFNLRPHATLGVDRSSIPIAARPAEIVEALRADIPEIEDAVQQVKQMWDRHVNDKSDASSQNIVEDARLDDELPLPSCLKDITREDMEIVLLGTGSSQPSKYRNVSSIYINLFSKGGFLFDCGEGTLGQLKRRYGVKDADDVVRSLSCIWISHIHADHHTGLSRILALRRDLLKDDAHDPLLVIGPGQLLRFLNAYERLEKLDIQFLDCKFTTRSHCYDHQPGRLPVDQRLKTLKKVLQEAGLETLISFPVDHFWEAPGDTPQAYGVSLNAAQRSNKVGEMIPGWKIVYSGDTRPCLELVEEARAATVLIHEATFEDDMESEAIGKKHSTTREAIDMGEKAGVYRIVLTHFSQRYPKIPVFGDSHMHNTCIGFDLMSINMADLRVFPQVLPHLKLLFRNEIGVDEVDEFPLEELTDAPS